MLELRRRIPSGRTPPLLLLMLALLLGSVLVLSGCRTLSAPEPEIRDEQAVSAIDAEADAPPAADPQTDASVAEPSLELDAVLPRDRRVRTGTLENGLRYYIRENRRPENRAELRLALDAGSILEDDDQLGLAHFAEHMAFNGTESFAKQEIVDYLETIGMRFGADVNAYTSFDETVYMLQLPTDDEEALGTGFKILEEWAHRVSFEGEEIEKERGVVVEEWRLGRGAGARIRDQQLPVLLADSLYVDRMPIGEKEILESFEHDTLRRYYRDWYRPELMAVVAVGDFDADAIEERIRDRFSRLRSPETVRERRMAKVPDHDVTRYSIVTDPELSGTSITVVYKNELDPQDRVRDYRRSLVESLFHSMLNQRLAERAREADPPFLAAGSSEGRFVRTKGAYMLSAQVEETEPLRGLEALLTEAERARRHGFVAAELERQKADYLRFLESAYEEREKTDSSRYAAEYIRNFLEGEPFPGIAYELALTRRYLPTITVEEVNTLADKWIRDTNRVILVQGPEKEGLELPDQEQLAAVFDGIGDKPIDPYVDQVADRPLVDESPAPAAIGERVVHEALDVHEWRLENGVRVFLKPTDFKNDEIRLTAYSPGGHSLVADADFVAGMTASSIVPQGGLGEFDLIELSKHLSGKRVAASPYIGELSEGVSGGGSPQDLETLFQLVYLTFTAPRFDREAFTNYQTRMRGLIKNQRANPDVVFGEAVNETLAQGHPRRRPFDETLIDEMDFERSFAIYEERFRDVGDFTFIIVGAFELETIEPLVRRYLGGLPAAGREESWRDVGVRPPDEVVEKTVYKGLEPKSRLRIIFTGPFEQTIVNRHRQQSMAELLQIRLRERLREEMGGTYGVSVNASSSHIPVEKYAVSIAFASDPERQPELRQAVIEEIERLKTGLATELEMTKLKETQRRERETALKTNGFWLGALRYALQNGEDPHQILDHDERVETLNPEEIREAARRYLDLERYVQVVLMPESAAEPDPESVTASDKS